MLSKRGGEPFKYKIKEAREHQNKVKDEVIQILSKRGKKPFKLSAKEAGNRPYAQQKR